MKDKYIKFADFKAQALKDSEVKKSYDLLKPKYEIVSLILDARITNGLTQAQLAKKIGTKQSAIARLESGSYNPTLSFLQKIAKALDKQLIVSFK